MTSQETKSIKSIPYHRLQDTRLGNSVETAILREETPDKRTKPEVTILIPRTVEQICSSYDNPEAKKHCDGMKCDGYHVYFCYTLKRKT